MELDDVRGRLAEVEQRFVRRLNQTEKKEDLQFAEPGPNVRRDPRAN